MKNYTERLCYMRGRRMDGGDSNALIMPNKKKDKKSKVQKQSSKKMKKPRYAKTGDSKSKKLSKSQKRKLKRLAEEKESEKLLAQSLELLEKYKISDDVYSLLQSSGKIGQVMTRKEQRQREMQLGKAGLGVHYLDEPNKRKKFIDASCQSTSDADDSNPNESVQHVVVGGTETSCSSSVHVLTQGTKSGITSDGNCIPDADSFKEALDEDISKEMLVVSENPLSSSFCGGGPKTITGMRTVFEGSFKDGIDDNLGGNLSRVTNSGECFKQGARTAPMVVHVSRPEEVENSRKDLPIVMMEQEIMEAIKENITVIICGETGCGKTTQLPQFLYEAGFGSDISNRQSGVIGITQPRRVAVLATAKRVAHELGLRLGKEVGFQVRHDKRVGENCSIKFMTDGILLREVQGDFLLKRYSVIILDEAHERSVNTDILIGMLSRVIRQRQALYDEQQQKVRSGQKIKSENLIFPLKLILMSATLRVEDFTSGTRIFHQPPPVIEVPTRQFPVTTYFSKRTHENYIGQAYKKVLDIHKKLPPGGILVFVTGQKEVENLCHKLRKASKELVEKNSKRNTGNEDASVIGKDETDGYDMKEIDEAFETRADSTQQQDGRFSSFDEYHSDSEVGELQDSDMSETESELEFNDDEADTLDPKTSETHDNVADALGDDGNLDALKAAFEALDGNSASRSKCVKKQINSVTLKGRYETLDPSSKKRREEHGRFFGPMCVLPLYAMLPAAAQLRVFGDTKEGERLVVVATNVAETSLTIPGIKYVVDTGKEKVKNYDTSTGMESYNVQWISKASADQRAGRAGRTGPGHCYRLYSAAAFSNEFPDFSRAEISKIPVDGVVLLMKNMGISKVVNFPFPTPPDAHAVVEAERCLKVLEALDGDGRLTSLGKMMAQYPLNPRHSRMLLTAVEIMRKEGNAVRPNLVLGYAIAAAAALSLSNPFDTTEQDGKSSPSDKEKTLDKQEKLKRKRLKEAIRLSRAKFSNTKSDALRAAYALQCYELSQDPSEFCRVNFLVSRTMAEMSNLKRQLLQLIFRYSFCGLNERFSWTDGVVEDVECAWRVPSDRCPLSRAEEDLLCRAICAGWADRIAKCIRASSRLFEGDVKAHAARYQACSIKETIYLHRWSSVSRSDPEFLVYNDLVHTKRPYIFGATSVESEWLVKYAKSLCTFSAPLTDPKPSYDHVNDQVLCSVIPYFGPHSWELPHHKLSINDPLQRVTVFAYALLDGQVLPCLKLVRVFMAAQPSIILRPEASGQKRVGNLLSKLRTGSRTIDSCGKLREVWKDNPMELHSEIRDWFLSGYDQFDQLWENMLQEALLSPEERFPSRGKKRKLGRRSALSLVT